MEFKMSKYTQGRLFPLQEVNSSFLHQIELNATSHQQSPENPESLVAMVS